MKRYKIAVIEGDGIGREVVPEGIRVLEAATARGYMTFDLDGQPVIQSDLPALGWYQSVVSLLQSRGHEAEKAALRTALKRSIGPDNGQGALYQLVAAIAFGPREPESLKKGR